MRMLFVADLHYALKQFDWLVRRAGEYDFVIIGGDLLDLASSLDFDVQIVVVEKYLRRIRQSTRLLVSSGNHDGDSFNAANEPIAEWLQQARAEGLFVDGESAVLGNTCVTACPWWDGPVSRAAVETLLVRESARRSCRWIWSHHVPPADSPVSWARSEFAGDHSLRRWIEQFQPEVVLSGHIHNSPFYPEGSWIDRIGETWVFNPGRQLGAAPAHISLDLAAQTAEWVTYEGQSLRQIALPEC